MPPPGTHLIGDTNDRAAFDLMLASGPVTKTQLGELTGLSKVTAGKMLSRLERRGLVEIVGEQQGGRGPNAALYAVDPSCGYVVAVHVGPDVILAAAADITGAVLAQVELDPNGGSDPVSAVRGAVSKIVRSARIPMERLYCLSIGTPGMVDPRSGDVRYSFDLPDWHVGVLDDLRHNFRQSVLIENDVNLAGLAERASGAARGVDNFVVAWIDRGIGLAVLLDGKLHRGVVGGAGEIGYLPVPGAALPKGAGNPRRSAFQSLVGGDAVRRLGREHGIRGSAVECVRRAVGGHPQGAAFLDELSARLALGLSGVFVVLDPSLCVLSGAIGQAGGTELAARVQKAVAEICPIQPAVVTTAVSGDPVLSGALQMGLDTVRDEVFSHDQG